jgi:MFS family permease
MLAGAGLLAAGMATEVVLATVPWAALLPLWFVLGLGNGLVLTPSGRLRRRSAHPGDRPALYAAQFALSHACWLLTYPLAGWLGAAAGTAATFGVLAGLTALGVALAAALWPAHDPEEVEHVHADLPPGDPHLAHAEPLPGGGYRHWHALVIDDRHLRWPR